MHCFLEQCMRAMLLMCLHAFVFCKQHVSRDARGATCSPVQALAAADKERQARQAEAARAAKAAKLAEQVCSSPLSLDS